MKYRFKLIAYRLPIILITGYLLIAIITVITVYQKFEDKMINDYTRMADGVTNLIADNIDLSKIDYYIEENYSSEEYMNILKKLYLIKDNYPDVYYLYIYKFYYDGEAKGKVIFDLDEEYTEDVPQDSIDWIGEDYIMDEPFASDINKIMQNGGEIWHTITTDDGEYLLSYVKPLFNNYGEYVCSACVDFSMTEIYRQNISFVYMLSSILGVIMLIACCISIYIIRSDIITPLNLISACIDKFKFDTDSDRFNNLNTLEELALNKDNEVGKLYNSFLVTMKESTYFMLKFNNAVDTIDELSTLTFKDALTGVNNSLAFDKFKKSYNNEDVAIVMADVNNLKYINDKYGHAKGDEYIKGCCDILCAVYDKNNIYRVGGDEFIIILHDVYLDNKYNLFEEAVNKFEYSYNNTNIEWQKFSMALGMAEKVTNNIDDTLKNADLDMYKNKEEFKRIHGAYRI